jgi:hypothetical protein
MGREARACGPLFCVHQICRARGEQQIPRGNDRKNGKGKSEVGLDADGVGLLVDLVAFGAFAFEQSLEDAEQAGVPVAEDEEE